MLDIHKKSYDIVTFSIILSTSWLRKCIDISHEMTLRDPVNHVSEIQLTAIQQPTIKSYKRTTNNYQQSINNCEHLIHKPKSEKIAQK